MFSSIVNITKIIFFIKNGTHTSGSILTPCRWLQMCQKYPWRTFATLELQLGFLLLLESGKKGDSERPKRYYFRWKKVPNRWKNIQNRWFFSKVIFSDFFEPFYKNMPNYQQICKNSAKSDMWAIKPPFFNS